MAENHGRDHDEHQRRQHQSDHAAHESQPETLQTPLEALSYPTSLIADPNLNGRGNQPVTTALMRQMQQTYGNRAVQRFLNGRGSGTPRNPGRRQTSNSTIQRHASLEDESVQAMAIETAASTPVQREEMEDEQEPVQTARVPQAASQPESVRRVQRTAATGQAHVRPTLAVQRALMTKAQWRIITKKKGSAFNKRGEKNPIIVKIDALLDAYPKNGTKQEKKEALGKLSIVQDWLERTKGKNTRRAAMKQLNQNILKTYSDENIPVPEGVHIEAGTGLHPELFAESHYAAEVALVGAGVDDELAQFQKAKPPDIVVTMFKAAISKMLDITPPLTGGTLDDPIKAAIKRYKQQYGLASPASDSVTKELLTSLREEKKKQEQVGQKAGLGQAIQELQNKLSSALGLDPPLASGVFDAATETAIKSFKVQFNLPNPTSADLDNQVWQELDARGKSDVGQARIRTQENLGGQMAGSTGNFLWAVHADKLEITVKISFDTLPGPASNKRGAAVTACKDAISNVWNNKFRIVNTGTADGLDLKFVVQDLQDQAGGDINRITLTDGDGRSDSGNWFIGDSRLYVSTAAHEFGHLLGLEDEYQRSHTDYKRIVGAEPVEGTVKMSDAQATDCATKLNTALATAGTRDEAKVAYENALKILKDFKLLHTEGTGMAVLKAYTQQYGADLVDRIGAVKGKFGKAADTTMLGAGKLAMSADSAHSRLVEPFTFESQSLMGGGGNVSEHNHGVEPRHVRQFIDYARQSKGGTWEVKTK